MTSLKHLGAAALAIVATVSVSAQEPAGPYKIGTEGDLSARLDCLEEAGATIISAHRGGPSPGLPENAIPTMDAVLHALPAMMEIDVAASPDGVHYLMHDRTLDRTTTGTGAVTDVPWKEVAQLRLVDEAGWVTPYRVPTLAGTLAWAKGKTVLQVDFKRTANFETVIAEIRKAGMEQGVILIAYTKAQALKLYELAPDMLISYSVNAPGDLDEIVEKSLQRAGLWNEVKDRLGESGTALSGGQQQRLCIARAIAVDPEVILMDEPASALDPIATAKIEELIDELAGRYAIVIVTHSMQQAARVSQRTAFFHLGKMVEYGPTDEIFTNPLEERTKDYITGRYG